jgi:hypothetical protein
MTVSHQGGSSQTYWQNGALLSRLASGLKARGLQYRLEKYVPDEIGGEDIEEIVVINPAAMERGEIRIGDDGSVTWEYFGHLDEAGAGEILKDVAIYLRATQSANN